MNTEPPVHSESPRMVLIDGGEFLMGSDSGYPDEGPMHRRAVAAFEIDVHPVTNREFARFVEATGYRTTAEQPLDATQFPQLTDEERTPGSMVFTQTSGPVDLGDWRQWWRWVEGADWRHPTGPHSGIQELPDHPVVQVSYFDAQAYVSLARKRLPTEAEWEFAARGGLNQATFSRGDHADDDTLLANHWQGRFPYLNTGAAGWAGTSPVGTFPPNGYGLFDLTGNVWEWTSDYYAPDTCHPDRERPSAATALHCHCGPARITNPGAC